MKETLFQILYEDEEILVINKSPGLVCHPTKGDALSSLVGRIRLYLGAESKAHLVNRLDRETSGLIVVAKTSVAAAALGRQWEQRTVRKTYLALVKGVPPQKQGLIEAPLGRDVDSPVAIKDCVRADGTPAQTEYRRLQSGTCPEGEFSLLEIAPRTGRKHQIRIHLASIGHPIVGDKLYGGDEQMYLSFVKEQLTSAQAKCLILSNQALHAAEITFCWRGENQRFQAEPSAEFRAFVARLSGTVDAR